MDRQTLSIMKACEAVGVSRRTIYNWISAGKVEYVRTAGGSIRIFADTLWRDAERTAGQRDQRTHACRRTGHTRERARASHGSTRMADSVTRSTALRVLFHRLNNQLGIVLAHAELLEAKAAGRRRNRARAAQVVTSVLDAMGTAKEIGAVPSHSPRRKCLSTAHKPGTPAMPVSIAHHTQYL